jgi:hypothetical protein
MMSVWRSSRSSLFLRTIILGLSATAAFGLFEAWPRGLPQWLQRWALQVEDYDLLTANSLRGALAVSNNVIPGTGRL